MDWVSNVCVHKMLRPLFQENFEKINWARLSENPNAIHLLEANLEKIDWRRLSQ